MNTHEYNDAPAHPLAASAYRNLRDDTEDSIRFVLGAISKRFRTDDDGPTRDCSDALCRFRADVLGEQTSRAYVAWRTSQPDSDAIPKLSRIISTFGRWAYALDADAGVITPGLAWRPSGHAGSKFTEEECRDALQGWLRTFQFRRVGIHGYLTSGTGGSHFHTIPPERQAYEFWASSQDLARRIPADSQTIARNLGGTWATVLREANLRGDHDPLVRAAIAEGSKTRNQSRVTALKLIAEATSKSGCKTIREFDRWVESEASHTEDPCRLAQLSAHSGRRISRLFPTWAHALQLATEEDAESNEVGRAMQHKLLAAVVLCSLELDRRPSRAEYELWRAAKPKTEREGIPTTNTVRRFFYDWTDALNAAFGGEFDG